jgi:hypothetical protein
MMPMSRTNLSAVVFAGDDCIEFYLNACVREDHRLYCP